MLHLYYHVTNSNTEDVSKIKQAKIYILIVQEVGKNVTLLAASKMILVIRPVNDSSTSGYAHRMEIRLLLNLTLVYITRTITWSSGRTY